METQHINYISMLLNLSLSQSKYTKNLSQIFLIFVAFHFNLKILGKELNIGISE